MKIIIITRPDFFEGETDLVNRLFQVGMERLHLRKPKATKQEMAEWIDRIDLPFRHRIVLHDHYELAKTFSLGGIHLNSRNPEPPLWVAEECESRPFTVSRSCHSLREVIEHKNECNYLFLSPIYDSISKEGYGAAFTRSTIFEAHQQGIIDYKVYALGGISFDRLQEVSDMGFSGAAILCDLWLAESPIEKYISFTYNSRCKML